MRTLFDLKRVLRYHLAMGIEEYPRNADVERFLSSRRPDGSGKYAPNATPTAGRPAVSGAGSGEALLEALVEEIRSCSLCSFAGKRAGIVAGLGNPGVRLMVVGDWSRQDKGFESTVLFGREEDEMLWKMMSAIELHPEQVYVTNCIKCCPKMGIDPDGDEAVTRCFSYVEREIAAVRPRLICAMGEMAAGMLLGKSAPLARLRGRMGTYGYRAEETVAVMPTFHPRFLLANPEMKKATWHDLQQVKRYLEEKRA